MNNRPYLLTLSSPTPNRDRFFSSAKKLNVELVTVEFPTYPGHIKKWEHIPDGLDPNRYVIFSDTDDVIFQRDFPEFTHDLYLAPENVTHRNTMWKDHIEKFPFFTDLMDKEVLNCGQFSMKVKTMYDYREFMMVFDDEYRKWGFEQMYFNMFVYSHPELSRVIDRTIFCPLFANVHHGVKKEHGFWLDKDKIIVAVHANGSQDLKGQL